MDSAPTLLLLLKSNTLYMKLGSSCGHFLQVELLVTIIFSTNNYWDLETTSTYGKIFYLRQFDLYQIYCINVFSKTTEVLTAYQSGSEIVYGIWVCLFAIAF